MIKGFLLVFDAILIVLFLEITIYAIKVGGKGLGELIAETLIIILLNSLFILNS